MKISKITIILILTTCLCLKVHETEAVEEEIQPAYNPEDFMTGNYREHTPGPNDKPVDDFVKSHFPELKSAQFVKVETQVVNGWNHRLKYVKNGEVWTVTVYESMDGGNYQIKGVVKSGKKVNENGQQSEIKYEARVENRGLLDVARDMFMSHQ